MGAMAGEICPKGSIARCTSILCICVIESVLRACVYGSM
jgi:hypothetical protein